MPSPVRPLFADLEPTPTQHFRVHLYGAVLRLLAYAAGRFGSFEAAVERFPFLSGYHDELATRLTGLSVAEALERWCQDIALWEAPVPGHLPLRTARQAAGLGPAEACWLLTFGLPDEDSRFGEVFEALQGIPGQRRPVFGLLGRCWSSAPGLGPAADVLHRWRELGFAQLTNPDDPRSEWVLQIPTPLWDALGGSVRPAAEGFLCRTPDELRELDQLILPSGVAATSRALVDSLGSGEVRAVVVRGPGHNGRRTLLGALARAAGRGLVELRADTPPEAERWRRLAALALALKALPVVVLDLGPGEVVTTPPFWPTAVPLAIVLGTQGGLTGPVVERAVTLTLDLPDVEARQRHWCACLPAEEHGSAVEFSRLLRIGSGNLRRLATLARTRAHLADRPILVTEDVVEGARSLNRESLDSLARALPPGGDLDELQATPSTWDDLEHLEQRCRHRERLPARLSESPGGRPGCGVRALLTGPSGTGKTLAARLLAGRLRKDLYRLDLSAVVNKYIGETEKNLNRILDRAEELDVILLLDEGDALLTRRTDVQNSNDRYANLETNFLLQRLESYQGILLITTNARERIDSAFERRMDVIVEFHLPDAEERWALWRAHLPPENSVGDGLLREVAARCHLTGGQIRNASLYATLLALDNGGVVTGGYLDAAVRREYVKQGSACPLRQWAGAGRPGTRMDTNGGHQ